MSVILTITTILVAAVLLLMLLGSDWFLRRTFRRTAHSLWGQYKQIAAVDESGAARNTVLARYAFVKADGHESSFVHAGLSLVGDFYDAFFLVRIAENKIDYLQHPGDFDKHITLMMEEAAAIGNVPQCSRAAFVSERLYRYHELYKLIRQTI
jgi:hypothetical protein